MTRLSWEQFLLIRRVRLQNKTRKCLLTFSDKPYSCYWLLAPSPPCLRFQLHSAFLQISLYQMISVHCMYQTANINHFTNTFNYRLIMKYSLLKYLLTLIYLLLFIRGTIFTVIGLLRHPCQGWRIVVHWYRAFNYFKNLSLSLIIFV